MEISRATQLHEAGQLELAERAYRAILAANPNEPQCTHMLGMLLHQRNDDGMAEAFLRRSLELAPNIPTVHNNFAMFCRKVGQLDEALKHAHRAMELCPTQAELHVNLGLILEDMNRIDDAISAFSLAVKTRADLASAREHLARSLWRAGRAEKAIEQWRQIVQINPAHAEAHRYLCFALGQAGRLVESVEHGQKAVQLNPTHVEARIHLAMALIELGQYDQSLAHLSEAMRLQPGNVRGMIGLARLFQVKRQFKEAEPWCRKALKAEPNNVQALSLLGIILHELKQIDSAIEACERATRLDPNNADAWNNLGMCLLDLGDAERAAECTRRALDLDPNRPAMRSNLLMTLLYVPGIGQQELFEEHLRYQYLHAAKFNDRQFKHRNDRNPDRPLRIGYVSPYFYYHAVATFIEPLLRAHDRSNFTVTCYSDLRIPDELTPRFLKIADQWHHTAYLNDEELALKINGNQEDILIDLSGHIIGNRLLAFARKPAPVQVTYMGYQNTTGLSAIDYRMTDALADPPGDTDPFYSEKLLRLPCFFCYQMPTDAPPVAPPPVDKDGVVTFGSLSFQPKFNPELMGLWAKLLHRVPKSRLLLVVSSHGGCEERLIALMAAQGISADRVRLVPRRGRLDYYKLYDEIDINLDPFPFNGHTTTCDALWMGSPVVTLTGNYYCSRMGTSVLSHLDLPDLIAADKEQYLQIASDLASDRTRLANLRASLRDRMRNSIITDEKAFAATVERAYRQIWRKWAIGE
ncbi:MAG TPA: tetratricopeptide repeat protein [Tepidisphaeraceae bacterium]|nr:tetratricopeptide repeat protein [Tepidisphaeraceae bacterium]